MAPFVMAIKITNNTDSDLKPLGTEIYNGYGDVQQQPDTILARSNGSGGVLEKVIGSDGLFGLVAYSTPDPNQTLVIWTTMPATAGTKNHCWVGLVQSSTNINQNLAKSCYNGPPGFTESKFTWEFSQSGDKFALVVSADVADIDAWETYTTVKLELYHSGSKVSAS
ncbi:hypothetical protein LY78DRAFT_697747 [Colletotrichum sublineola]|nr:hypothetical protein LY78DRAFT_697747 [Colletotrichum sublineola]